MTSLYQYIISIYTQSDGASRQMEVYWLFDIFWLWWVDGLTDLLDIGLSLILW
jgi:hypothetical protein